MDNVGKVSNGLETLIEQLQEVFKDDHINIENVEQLMSSYKSTDADWKKYAKFERYKYTRNLVDKGNGKYNLMILCWGEGQASAIHDHSNSHCFMKILKGTLRQTMFDWPQSNSESDFNQMTAKEISTLKLNEVCYINDDIGLHRVDNPSHVEKAVSLHLYIPPFSSCRAFDERTGKQLVCPVTFWSEYGVKVDNLKKVQQRSKDHPMSTS